MFTVTVITKLYKTEEELIGGLFQYLDGSGRVKGDLLVEIIFSLQEQIDKLKKGKK